MIIRWAVELAILGTAGVVVWFFIGRPVWHAINRHTTWGQLRALEQRRRRLDLLREETRLRQEEERQLAEEIEGYSRELENRRGAQPEDETDEARRLRRLVEPGHRE